MAATVTRGGGMSQQLVGTQTVESPEALRSLIQSVADGQPYYCFLRWAHKVSGIVLDVGTEFPSPEGQVFGKQFELRWKCSSNGYEVLLLHCKKAVTELDFTPVADHWDVSSPLGAYLFDRDETRFPKRLTYPEGFQLRQRYFQDSRTATIHFVALTYQLKVD
jgi:hypothetical protein